MIEGQHAFAGLGFSHPASHTPRVEVVLLPETAPGARFACETFCRWLGKTPVEPVEVVTALAV